jgi:D-3-phosphoglycerate dehydrogenase
LKILVSDPISEDGLGILRKSQSDFDYSPEISADELLEKISDYDALIVRSRTKVTREVIFKAPKLKVVGRAGVGTDNIDSEAAREKDVRIVNTPDALTNAVAEFTVGLMIDLSRGIINAAESMRQSEWKKSAFVGSELHGKTYGAIGLGRIGRRVAEIAHAFEMKILAQDIVPIPDEYLKTYNVSMVDRDRVLRESDYVDLHVPLTDETRHMMNTDNLSKMKRSAFLINTSRGPVVDEDALLRALDGGTIAGAALDVFEVEPPKRKDLITNKKIIPTPHIAGQTEEAQAKAGTQIVEEVLAFLSKP